MAVKHCVAIVLLALVVLASGPQVQGRPTGVTPLVSINKAAGTSVKTQTTTDQYTCRSTYTVGNYASLAACRTSCGNACYNVGYTFNVCEDTKCSCGSC